MSSFVVFLSPNELENFTDDKMVVSETYIDKAELEKKRSVVYELMDRLPKREADMIYMYFFKKKFQADIGKIFNVSQGDVSYKIKRGVRRLKFLMAYPELEEFDIIEDLAPILPYENVYKVIKDLQPGCLDFCGDNLYMRIMVGMYKTSSQSVVAETLGIYQNRVRYRFRKGLERIQEHADLDYESYGEYLSAFEMVRDNPNILRELKVQDRWKHKFQDVLV